MSLKKFSYRGLIYTVDSAEPQNVLVQRKYILIQKTRDEIRICSGNPEAKKKYQGNVSSISVEISGKDNKVTVLN